MRNTVLTVLSLGFATALASPALAKEQLSATPDALSVQAIHNYAGCVANTTPRGAAEALELDFSSPAYGKKISQLSKGHSDSRCMSASRLQYNQVLFAGGMAERLLVDKVQPARFPTMVAYDPASAPIKARSAQEVIGMCMVRAEPAKSWAVFATAPTSHEEASAMQALAPTLINCVPAGQKMALNKPGLRALLALAAYRLSAQRAVVADASAKQIMENPPQ
jgi:hypothetical protein